MLCNSLFGLKVKLGNTRWQPGWPMFRFIKADSWQTMSKNYYWQLVEDLFKKKKRGQNKPKTIFT